MGLEAAPAYRQTMDRLRALKRVTPKGVDYWIAREVCEVLGYTWEGFGAVLDRAQAACAGNGADPANHFRRTSKMVRLGSGAERKIADFFLSRGACDLIAMNGDPAKPEIAAAQAYFAVQTRRMEIRDEADEQLVNDLRRLELRGRVTEAVKKVSAIAQAAGVRNSSQPFFHDARYRGLYNAPLKEVKRKKGLLDKENLMDRAGPMELSMNDFQMNLAADVIAREKISKNEPRAIARNRQVAERVRAVVAESGGTPPENLPAEPPIKEAKTDCSKKATKAGISYVWPQRFAAAFLAISARRSGVMLLARAAPPFLPSA